MQKKKLILLTCISISAVCLLAGCGKKEEKLENETELETMADDKTEARAVTSEDGTVHFSSETGENEAYDFGYKASDYVSFGDYSNVKVDNIEAKEVTNADVLEEVLNRMTAAGMEAGDLTDEIAAQLSDQKYPTADEYKDYIRKVLEAKAEEVREGDLFVEVLNQIADTIDIKEIPDEEKEMTFEEIQSEAAEKGVNITELAKQYQEEGKFGSSDESDASINLIIQYIAEKENISVTGKDIAAYKEELLEYGNSKDTIEKIGERRIARLALKKKVCSYIAENCV